MPLPSAVPTVSLSPPFPLSFPYPFPSISSDTYDLPIISSFQSSLYAFLFISLPLPLFLPPATVLLPCRRQRSRSNKALSAIRTLARAAQSSRRAAKLYAPPSRFLVHPYLYAFSVLGNIAVNR